VPKTLQHLQAAFIMNVPEGVVRGVLLRKLNNMQAADGVELAEQLREKLTDILKVAAGEGSIRSMSV
jgi:hypothetical protein